MIELLKEIEDSQLPIFARKSFLSSRSDEYGWLSDGTNVLPFIIDKRYIFKRLIFTTGILSKNGALSVSQSKVFLNAAVDHIRNELSVDMIAKAQANAVFQAVPEGAVAAPWGTFVKDIQLSDEELMQSLKSKTRNMVRRAQKGNVAVVPAAEGELWELMNDMFKRQGQQIIAPSSAYITDLAKKLKGHFLILKAVHDGEIQGIAGIPFDHTTGYYLFGASIPRPFTGSLNLLQFEAMKILRDKGVQQYDFVGARIDPPPNSKYYKIQRFKTSFDPDLIEGFAFKVVLNPFKYWLMNAGLTLHSFLKGKKYDGDPIDQIRKIQG